MTKLADLDHIDQALIKRRAFKVREINDLKRKIEQLTMDIAFNEQLLKGHQADLDDLEFEIGLRKLDITGGDQ